MRPLVKWAGGKAQILERIIDNMPQEYGTYYEPFLGGGAVLFGIAPDHAIVNDINSQLINLYRSVQNEVGLFIQAVAELDAAECNKDFYLEKRAAYNLKISNNELDVECAALMVWINKHCFNGLYRVNSRGLFNVPYNNRRVGNSIDVDEVRLISEYLNNNNIEFHCGDFEAFCNNVQEGDFVYFDSPYVPVSDTANFTDYTQDGFTLADHQRLAALYRRLTDNGVHVLLSNNDVPLVHELYADYHIEAFDVRRSVNRNANGRNSREVLIRNY